MSNFDFNILFNAIVNECVVIPAITTKRKIIIRLHKIIATFDISAIIYGMAIHH
jgi:hypothetical protein